MQSECINGRRAFDSKFNHHFTCSFIHVDAYNLPSHIVIGKKKKHEAGPLHFNCRINRLLDC